MTEINRTYEERKQLFGNMMLQCGLSLIEIDEINRRLDSVQELSVNRRIQGDIKELLSNEIEHWNKFAVAEALVNLTKKLGLKWERKYSPYVVGLFHDLCKCDSYMYNEYTHQWEYNTNSLMTGHGEASVILAQSIVNLSAEEIQAIDIAKI